jgi:hypothetical protein
MEDTLRDTAARRAQTRVESKGLEGGLLGGDAILEAEAEAEAEAGPGTPRAAAVIIIQSDISETAAARLSETGGGMEDDVLETEAHWHRRRIILEANPISRDDTTAISKRNNNLEGDTTLEVDTHSCSRETAVYCPTPTPTPTAKENLEDAAAILEMDNDKQPCVEISDKTLENQVPPQKVIQIYRTLTALDASIRST